MTRAENLRRALEIAQETPSPFVAGDALGILDSILEDAIPCVFHAHAVYQFAPEDRHSLYALLVERSALRDFVVRIGMEPSEAGRSVLSIYRHGYGSNVWQLRLPRCMARLERRFGASRVGTLFVRLGSHARFSAPARSKSLESGRETPCATG
jgi:hypothetical protein